MQFTLNISIVSGLHACTLIGGVRGAATPFGLALILGSIMLHVRTLYVRSAQIIYVVRRGNLITAHALCQRT